MPQTRSLSLIRRLSQVGTVLQTWLQGEKVGQDSLGNTYYRARKTSAGQRERRWVMFADEPEASLVPPEWRGWLHYTLPVPMAADSPYRKAWQQNHQPNLTGTGAAYLPPGHALRGGQRATSTSDYEAWKPE